MQSSMKSTSKRYKQSDRRIRLLEMQLRRTEAIVEETKEKEGEDNTVECTNEIKAQPFCSVGQSAVGGRGI
jgi:hypothetical protein